MNQSGASRLMKQKNIAINAILNAVKSSLPTILSLISYPYILRTLGVASLGKVCFVTSIVGYFSQIAMLGVPTYGVREGAKFRDDKVGLSKFVSQVFTINVISTIVSYILLCALVCVFTQLHNYILLFVIISIGVVSQTLALDWVNVIFEDFSYITLRSIVIYAIQILLIFLLIKSENDYYTYAALTVLSSVVVCVTNVFYCRRYCQVHLTHLNLTKSHLRPLFVLFANTVAISIYVSFDNIMLGAIKGDESVGLYAASTKVYSVIKGILIAVYSVAIPRLSVFFGSRDFVEYKRLFTNLWCIVSLLLLPAGIGLFCLAEEVNLIVGGKQYLAATPSLRILSLALIVAIFGGLMTACLNVTICKESINLKATVISAALNFVLNIVSIPLFAQNGAALTTLIAEIFVFIYCVFKTECRNRYFDGKTIITNIAQSVCGIVAMVTYILVVKHYVTGFVLRSVLSVGGSVLIYGIVLILVKNYYARWLLQTAKNISFHPFRS